MQAIQTRALLPGYTFVYGTVQLSIAYTLVKAAQCTSKLPQVLSSLSTWRALDTLTCWGGRGGEDAHRMRVPYPAE